MIMSEFWEAGRKAEVIRKGKWWGCNYYEEGKLIATEMYAGHSESYAESAAENYVLGVKNFGQDTSL